LLPQKLLLAVVKPSSCPCNASINFHVADSRLRRDVMSGGGVAPVFSPGTATVTSTHLGGLEEKFAFARALSRLHEMSRMTGL